MTTPFLHLMGRLNTQRQTILRLPLATRWLLFLAAYFSLTFGGVTLMAFLFVRPTPAPTPHPAPLFATVR